MFLWESCKIRLLNKCQGTWGSVLAAQGKPQHTQKENQPGLVIWESGPTNSPVKLGSQDSGSGSKTWLRQGPRTKDHGSWAREWVKDHDKVSPNFVPLLSCPLSQLFPKLHGSTTSELALSTGSQTPGSVTNRLQDLWIHAGHWKLFSNLLKVRIGPVKPDLLRGIPAHSRGVGIKWSLRYFPAQAILWFYGNFRYSINVGLLFLMVTELDCSSVSTSKGY